VTRGVLSWRAVPAGATASVRRPNPAETGRSFVVTFALVAVLAAFLSPLVQSGLTALKSPEQISQTGSPLLPSDPVTFTWEGETYDVFQVPIDGATRELALVKPGRRESQFLDPADPGAGPITWQGSWRTLDRVWVIAPKWSNFAEVWNVLDFPRLLFNTVAIALIGMVGTVTSCLFVAYGFARFRFPGRGLLFGLLIATIFLPAAVTLIPVYTIMVKLGWVGTWLPLLVPTFLANAFDVFLLRQYLLTIPREMDEAASIDGAGPMRTLVSVIVPQAWPAIAAVGIFHFVYSWNDFFGPLIYLAGAQELQTLSLGLASLNGIYYQNSALIQAGTLMTLAIPVVLFIVFQRVFTRGIVITGVEK
jgi:multiple sugar transport system permease protein